MKREKKRVLTILFVFFTLWYGVYNSPVFMQIFAHTMYVKTKVTMDTSHGFSCIARNITYQFPPGLLLNAPLGEVGHVSTTHYEYEVDGKSYRVRNFSYMILAIPCGEKVHEAYYFPLYPEWSVVNNWMPFSQYIFNLFLTSFLWIAVCYGYVREMRKKPPAQTPD